MTRAERVLVVLLGGHRVGTITEERDDLTLIYDDDYRNSAQATPLSLSMPLTSQQHVDQVVRSFMWGLLPDNELVLERWARTYQVSPRNPFALLRHVGADCAGAAQFAPPEDVDALLAGTGGIDWISEAEIGQRLRTLRKDPTAWHLSATGQFSLAGAQAKTALYFDPGTGRWGDPRGATPTTHIIKPAVAGLDDHDLNEHICLQAARMLGLDAASSEIARFEAERAIVVERYDRLQKRDGAIQRIHQEDLCQALGVPPTAKYQNEGGPTPEQIIAFLRERTQHASATGASRTIDSFFDALAFNWIVAGTDAHAKNYSVLLSGAQVRLAPMYDVASALPYDDMYLPKLKMAMRIGGEYGVVRVERRHWHRFAEAVGLDPDQAIQRIDDMASQITDAFAGIVDSESVRAVRSELPNRLLDRIARRADVCRQALTRR
jgi:serine/threonine-protein kinase HipA